MCKTLTILILFSVQISFAQNTNATYNNNRQKNIDNSK
jgi:hypothetical protein